MRVSHRHVGMEYTQHRKVQDNIEFRFGPTDSWRRRQELTNKVSGHNELPVSSPEDPPSLHDARHFARMFVHDRPEEIQKAKASGHVYAVKLYPAGETGALSLCPLFSS